MADKAINRIVPKEGAQQIIDNESKGLPEVKTSGATAKAAEPDKTKTVLSKEEAEKTGINTSKLPTQFELEHPYLRGSVKRNVSDKNGWIDNDGKVHLNPRSTEASSAYERDLKNRTSTAPQVKTAMENKTQEPEKEAETETKEETATGKFINPFQKEKEAADKAVEDANILVDRVKQSAAKHAEKLGDYKYSKDDSLAEKVTKVGRSIRGSFLGADIREVTEDLERLAKDLKVDLGDVAKSVGIEDISKEIHLTKFAEVHEKLLDIAEERLAAAKTKQQEAQANYTKAEEEAAKRKAEQEAKEAAERKAEQEAKEAAEREVAESTRNQLTEVNTKEQEAQAKAETEDPLKKAEELEPESQTPAEIKKFSNDLNRFVIQAYLNGDFGKKSSPNAVATMGYFILDKIGAALVNASEVARGLSPSAKSQWSKILDKQTELLGNRITANWYKSLSKSDHEALTTAGVISVEIAKLPLEQKSIAQSNINALLVRKSELQTLISQLKSDQGWEAYAQAMNAVVGTSKGLISLGVTDASNSSSNKGSSDTLSVNVSTGSVPSKFVSGGVSNDSTWNNSSAKALSKSNSLSQDALALAKFKSGEEYANATREAKTEANEQLIKRLEGQIEIIDKCIDSWGKDLGL